MNTRDTFGFAAKGAWFEVKEEIGQTVDTLQPIYKYTGFDIFKDPVTDDGTKKSLKGMVAVFEKDGDHYVKIQCTQEEEETGLLQVIYENGNFYNQSSLTEIRSKINELCNEKVLEPEI
jgi:nicotinamide phosphoribosyltransferase